MADETAPEVHPPDGEAPIGGSNHERHQRHLGQKRIAPQGRHHDGRNHHPCPALDQERVEAERPGDSPEQEGQTVVLRHKVQSAQM